MFTLAELRDFLEANRAQYEIIGQETPIVSTRDAAKYFDIGRAAPALILDTGAGLMLLIASAQRGKLDFEGLRQKMQLPKLKLADRKKVERTTGYKAGAIPLIGVGLPCVFDDALLAHDYVYGGSGDELHTLKISPRDVKRLNHVVFTLD